MDGEAAAIGALRSADLLGLAKDDRQQGHAHVQAVLKRNDDREHG